MAVLARDVVVAGMYPVAEIDRLFRIPVILRKIDEIYIIAYGKCRYADNDEQNKFLHLSLKPRYFTCAIKY